MDVDVRLNMFLKLHTVGLVRVRSIAISVSVCLSVCPIAYLNNHTSTLRQIVCTYSSDRGSVLL